MAAPVPGVTNQQAQPSEDTLPAPTQENADGTSRIEPPALEHGLNRRQVVVKLLQSRPEHNESMIKYIRRMRLLGHQNGLTDTLIIPYIVNGIPGEEIEKNRLYSCNDYLELLDVLHDYEVKTMKNHSDRETSASCQKEDNRPLTCDKKKYKLRRHFTIVTIEGERIFTRINAENYINCLRVDIWKKIKERADEEFHEKVYSMITIPTVIDGVSYDLEYKIVPEDSMDVHMIIGEPLRDVAKLIVIPDAVNVEPLFPRPENIRMMTGESSDRKNETPTYRRYKKPGQLAREEVQTVSDTDNQSPCKHGVLEHFFQTLLDDKHRKCRANVSKAEDCP